MRIILDIDTDEVNITSKKTAQPEKVITDLESPSQSVSIETNDAGAAPTLESLQNVPLTMITQSSTTPEEVAPSKTEETIDAGAAPSMNSTDQQQTTGKLPVTEVISTTSGQITIVDAGPAAISNLENVKT